MDYPEDFIEELQSLDEQRPWPEQPIPIQHTSAWVRRMDAGSTKAKDFTGFINGAAIPAGSDGAA